MNRLKKNIILYIIFSAVVYLILSVYADFNSLYNSLLKFNWTLIPILLLISFVNFYTKFLKWDYYVNLLNIGLSKLDSLGIFLSSLALSLTPGKIGDFIKSYWVNQLNGYPIRKSASIIFAERVTEFLSLVFLALVGALVYNHEIILIVITGMFFLGITFLVSRKNLSLKLIDKLENIKLLKNYVVKLRDTYLNSFVLLKPVPLIKMFFLSLISWLVECFGFYIILSNFDKEISIFLSIFIYSFSMIVGAISMLPAGLGITEGSLTLMIVEQGFTKENAVAVTLLIRLVTLWFSILVGVISLMLYRKKLNEKIIINLNAGEKNGKV